jgi:Tfp pilus assembly protein PilF
MGNIEDAIEEFKVAIKHPQPYIGAHYNLALLYEKRKMAKEAIYHLK